MLFKGMGVVQYIGPPALTRMNGPYYLMLFKGTGVVQYIGPPRLDPHEGT